MLARVSLAMNTAQFKLSAVHGKATKTANLSSLQQKYVDSSYFEVLLKLANKVSCEEPLE